MNALTRLSSGLLSASTAKTERNITSFYAMLKIKILSSSKAEKKLTYFLTSFNGTAQAVPFFVAVIGNGGLREIAKRFPRLPDGQPRAVYGDGAPSAVSTANLKGRLI